MPTDLRHHERRVFRFDAKHDSHLQLHREAVLRDHLERVEGVRNFSRRPFHGLVGGRDDDRGDRQRIDVVATRSDDRLLNAAKTVRHDIGFVGAFIQSAVGRISGQQVSFDLRRGRCSSMSSSRAPTQSTCSCSSRSMRSRTFAAIARRTSSEGSLPTLETTTATSPGFTSFAVSGITLNSSGLM